MKTEEISEDVYNSFPLFYCQHRSKQWECKHYEVVEKDFYSIATKCRFLGVDGETCNSLTCNSDACKLFLHRVNNKSTF